MDLRDAVNRDLLIGLLALQNGLIDQDVLILAFRAWARDKSRPIAGILAALGAIDVDERALLEGLASKHLKRNGDDIEKSVVALNIGGSVRASLAKIGDPDIEATLGHVGSGSAATDNDANDNERTGSYASGTAAGDGQRFRILRPHARGGLGAVFVALDAELNREVALKQILDHHADDPTSRTRFVLEAEITGGLEHPGIVPVYGLGNYGDGRPYYAMRFVRGDTLKETIAAFHDDETLKNDPGRRSLALRKLLRRFVDVCNAIDYAHNRGVLHRDIKPANVIVGKHGETLVVDWGLAKSMGKADVARSSDERPLNPRSASGSAQTLPGSAIGTPAYMSPEQATGDMEHVGPLSDVYSLGAALYCLLTGKTPFEGEDVGAVLRAVQRGEFPPPRQLDRSISQPLEAVCLKAMALRPDDRFASPRSLAEDVERWMADEPVSARREPWAERARRWMRRHRTGVSVAAALVIVVALGLGVNNVLVSRQRARAEANFGLARAAVDDMYTQVAERWLSEQAQLEPLQREFLLKALRFYERFAQPNSSDPGVLREAGKAARRVGEIQQRLGGFKDAEAAYRRALNVLGGLGAGDRAAPEDRYELALTHNRLGWMLWITGRTGEPDLRAALSLLAQLVESYPSVPAYRREQAATNSSLGLEFSALGRHSEAEVMHREALRLREALARQAPDTYQADLSRTLLNLGLLLKRTGRFADAEDAMRRSVAAAEDQIARTPRDPAARHSLAIEWDELANLLAYHSRPDEAEVLLRRANALVEALATDFPSVIEYQNARASIRRDLANVLQDQGLQADAEPAYVRAIEASQALAKAHPEVPHYRRSLAVHHHNLSGLYRNFGRVVEPETEFRIALELVERLAADFPGVLDYKMLLGQFQRSHATFLRATGRFTEAEPVFQRAIGHLEALTRAHPDLVEVRDLLAGAQGQAGDLLLLLHKPVEAERALYRGAEIGERLATDFPDVPNFANATAINLQGLAQLALDRRELATARKFQERALRHARAAMAASPRILVYSATVRRSYGLLAELQLREGDAQAALESARSLESLPEGNPIADYNTACYMSRCLGVIQDAQWPDGKRVKIAQAYGDRAVAALRRALERGYRNVNLIRKDPDLDPLRSRPDFQALLLDLTFPADPFARPR